MNGPVGVFEFNQFAGTEALARAIAESDAFSIAGGGDTLAAIAKFGVTEQISYISTGGFKAFLEFLEGKELPVVARLEKLPSKQIVIRSNQADTGYPPFSCFKALKMVYLLLISLL